MADDDNNDKQNPHRSTTTYTDNVNHKKVDSSTTSYDSWTKDYHLSHPVADVSELPKSAYQHAKLREANTGSGFEPGERTETEERHVERKFDKEVLAIAPRALKASGLDTDSFRVSLDTDRVNVMVLRAARADTFQSIKTHISQFEWLQDELSVSDWELEVNRLEDQYKDLDDIQRNRIEEAAMRILYALYRVGQPFPRTVWDKAVKSSETALLTESEKNEIEQGKIPSDDEYEALQNWADKFLTECVRDVVSFDRDKSKTTFPPIAIVGMFAHAALQSRHLTEAPATATHWVADPSVVPARQTVSDAIRSLSVEDVETLGQEMNQAFIEFAEQYEVFDESLKLAFDPTSIPQDTDPDESQWLHGNAAPLKGDVTAAEADAKWEFGVAGVIESDLHCILGIHPHDNKDADNDDAIKPPQSLSRIFRPIRSDTSVSGRVIMDRELIGAELIKRCRDVVGENWVILGKVEHDLEDILEDATPEESDFINLNNYENDYEYCKGLTNQPNVVVVPIPDEERVDTSQTHRLFLTDLPKSAFDPSWDDNTDDSNTATADTDPDADIDTTEAGDSDDDVNDEPEIDPEYVNFSYRKRYRIENSIQQLKYGFKIPFEKSTAVQIKYCTMYFSAIFYNLHNLINSCTSVEHGLPLGEDTYVTSGQVLSAIRNAAFEMAADDQ